MRFHWSLVFWAALALVLAACNAPATPPPTNKLQVVATFSVLGDFAQQVGGEYIALTTLVGSGMDTHIFAPTPADGVALSQATLVLENGLGFEPWLDKLYTATEASAQRVVVTEGLTLLSVGQNTEQPTSGQADPHVWHSVANAILMVRNIQTAFANADPAHAADYEANAARYIAELQTLDAWVFDQVQTVPAAQRQLLTNHDTLQYFAHRYGFKVLGSVWPASTEGAAPSAAELAALIDAVKAAGVRAVFAENIANQNLISQLADEAGITVVNSLYTDALGPADSAGSTYMGMMQTNVSTIVAALTAP